MANNMNSFHITDMIYDSENRYLTYKFVHNGRASEKVAIGYATDEDIIEDFKKILNKYFAKS